MYSVPACSPLSDFYSIAPLLEHCREAPSIVDAPTPIFHLHHQPRPSPSPRLEPFSALQSTAVSQPARRNSPAVLYTTAKNGGASRRRQQQTPAAEEKAWLAATANAMAAYCTPMGAIHRKASKSLAAERRLELGRARERASERAREETSPVCQGHETRNERPRSPADWDYGLSLFSALRPSSSYRSANRGGNDCYLQVHGSTNIQHAGEILSSCTNMQQVDRPSLPGHATLHLPSTSPLALCLVQASLPPVSLHAVCPYIEVPAMAGAQWTSQPRSRSSPSAEYCASRRRTAALRVPGIDGGAYRSKCSASRVSDPALLRFTV
ncbi:hypothetical protein M441DRAFT_453254 [Trichoderma asperellum CBS 433.97]|uniref:Uncharacterized protein n=1 Tax=Trichoderma asperellum (strain ATCC 204424 / CBS 433.97 / NBRC 101777) TaxID=1042311 RepID=A0A2T3ZG76_TRIA4|nr:hypothetical protein M441DRAFT_453254 [Trichoderma asperellum CBS 433.97]PTB43790.1 hypothetical protein M441DRAFT_453254 [Trichoderma asperellum CBS 433.97]